MARKYSKSASKDVKRAMHKKKRGTLKSGRSGKKVKAANRPSLSVFLKLVRRARRSRKRRRVKPSSPLWTQRASLGLWHTQAIAATERWERTSVEQKIERIKCPLAIRGRA